MSSLVGSAYVRKQSVLRALRNEVNWLERTRFDLFVVRIYEISRSLIRRLRGSNDRIVNAVLRESDELGKLTDAQLNERLREVRSRLRVDGVNDETVIASFAVARETSRRVLGMAHHHTQIRASLALLQGAIAEMATGEGKTLAATLAAATAALAGIPVHVVTVNDYLAERDAEEMIPLYQALGLSVGIVVHDRDLAQRREAYHCDICYCSNKELTFDYLKDRIVLDGRESLRAMEVASLTQDVSWKQQLLLRGLHFAIVDEADSVFIDESRTPLIISGQESFGEREEVLLRQAMVFAGELEENDHFTVSDKQGIQLTRQGKDFLREQTSALSGLWRSALYREPLVVQALSALHRYELDQDYIIDEEGCIQIVDPYTGRIMPGRSWGQGLQQMIEIKEGLELTKPRQTQAEISYQNFFRKYANLAGMTGTGVEVASELQNIYGLRSERIPLLKDSRREQAFQEVYQTQAEKWERVAELAGELSASGQAILVGTSSVASSEAVSRVLDRHGVRHRVLNARQDSEEAEIVSEAGRAGSVMVATSMAGRGTDIKLSDETRSAGGLHVIITELQDSSRIDRQLAGRSARQGDPGRVSEVLSLEDPLVVKLAPPLFRLLEPLMTRLNHRQRYWLVRYCQQRLERLHFRQRMDLVKQDSQRQKTLAFARRLHQGS